MFGRRSGFRSVHYRARRRSNSNSASNGCVSRSERSCRRVYGDPPRGRTITFGARKSKVNDFRNDVGEFVEIEGALVRNDGHIRADTEPGSEYILSRRRRILADTVEASSNSEEAPTLRVVSEKSPGETTGPGLGRGEITSLLGGDLEELMVIRLCLRVMHTSNYT